MNADQSAHFAWGADDPEMAQSVREKHIRHAQIMIAYWEAELDLWQRSNLPLAEPAGAD